MTDKSKRIGPRMISLGDLHPHPLNANVMPDDLREKLKVHISRTGRYPFIVVRPHPEGGDQFQILDGHHRVDVLRELGHAEARHGVPGEGVLHWLAVTEVWRSMFAA